MKKSRNHNNLPTGWRKVKLGKLLKVETGRRPSGGVLAIKSGIPSIGAEHLNDRGGFNLSSLKYIPEDYFKKSTRGKIKENDILVVKDGATIGKVSRVSKYFPFFKAMVNEHVFIVRSSNENLLNQTFLFYKIFSHEGKEMIKSSISGSAQGGLKKDFLDHWETYIPPLSIQKRIADILSAFDDKIELNNKINQILEEMAQAIFKEWFVRFRFSGWQKVKFVNSELGKIPEGWRVGDLYELIEFEGGSQPPKEEHIYEKRPGYIRFIQNRDYTSDAHITYIEESKRNKICDEYDIMMDKYGEAGKVRFGLAGAYNVALAKITPKPPLMREYLRWFLKQPEIQQLIEGSAVASTRSSVNKLVFKNLKILLPPKRLMEKFEEIGRLYIENYLKIKAENQKLSTLRDLLLPKLMSGEIRV